MVDKNEERRRELERDSKIAWNQCEKGEPGMERVQRENIPIIGKNMGRPPDPPLSEREKEIIREVKQKYKLEKT